MADYPILDDTIKDLLLDKDSGLKYYEDADSWISSVPYRTKYVLDILKPYAFYNFNDQPYILFFKDVKSNEEKSKIHKAIWNFQKSPVVIFDEENQLHIYNGLDLDDKNILLKTIEGASLKDFSYWELHSGSVWEKFYDQFNKRRLDDYLLSNISGAIGILTTGELAFKGNKRREIANNLIGRLIFSRYLIDRNVEISDRFISVDSPRESFINLIGDKTLLFEYFAYLWEKFNGNLFPLIDGEYELITQSHLSVLQALFRGDNVISGQLSLFDIYDFNIIPVELVSNIYERFIGREIQEVNKSFYTPQFLVDYILTKTVRPHLEIHNGCKVLDPSCGSGIFLVETLRSIIEAHLKRNNGEISDDDLRNLTKDNIYGIDKDENAINIAIFSLYITLLDYKHPKEIEHFVLPELKGDNFIVKDFFEKDSERIFKDKSLDFILGNPPWGNVKGIHTKYCRSEGIPAHRNEISRSFLARVKDFSHPNTVCALIVTSKILYNTAAEAKSFRINYFLKNFAIRELFELSPVRHNIFTNAIGPAAIIFYKYAPQEDIYKNIVTHISLKPNRFFSLFKTIVIEKFDQKKISQKYFIQNDWLWKVMLYGNTLDYRFIKRLKEFVTIQDKIDEYNFLTQLGLQIGGGDKNDAKHLIGTKYLDTRKHMLQRFYTETESNDLWNEAVVHRPRTPELFKAPYVLIKKGITSDFKLATAYSDQDFVFTDSITAIKGNFNQASTLKEIVGLLNSKLFSYYIFGTGSSTGIEREQVHKEEKFSFPYISDQRLANLVDEIQSLETKKYKQFMDITNIEDKEYQLDEIVTELFEINDVEKDLIDYTDTVSIPLFQKSDTPFSKVGKEVLLAYADVFNNHFSKRYNNDKEHFVSKIYLGEYYHAIRFIIEEKGELESDNTKILDFAEQQAFEILLGFSMEKITKELFVQKDVKGFEKNGFYVIKPNEYKNWHRALSHLDLAEFMEAIVDNNQHKH